MSLPSLPSAFFENVKIWVGRTTLNREKKGDGLIKNESLLNVMERVEIWICWISIDQFRYIKIQPKTIDLSARLLGINTEFVGFIPQSLALRSIVLGWILIHRNWSIIHIRWHYCVEYKSRNWHNIGWVFEDVLFAAGQTSLLQDQWEFYIGTCF